jgi:hypothetical protein
MGEDWAKHFGSIAKQIIEATTQGFILVNDTSATIYSHQRVRTRANKTSTQLFHRLDPRDKHSVGVPFASRPVEPEAKR